MTKLQMQLLDIISADGAEWKDIVAGLRSNKIKNWSKVRDELQALINLGLIHRLPDIRTELYARLK